MSPPTLTAKRLAELLKRYPHEANATLAADFGLTPHKVANLAFNNGVKKASTTRWQHHNPEGIVGAAHQAALAAGAAGIDRQQAIAAMPQYRENSVCTALRLATSRGLLHCAGRRRSYRWFADPADALVHNAVTFGSALRAAKAPPTARGPAHTDQAAVITADTRHTVCPPTGRLTPAALSDGLFANLKPGRYLDAEAKPWINAATTKGTRP